MIIGDIFNYTINGYFDVLIHGCNCQSKMGSGIVVPMSKYFKCNEFPMELMGPNINKLGCIDYKEFFIHEGEYYETKINDDSKLLNVVNCYTQNFYGKNHSDGVNKPLDYEALTLCMRKLNNVFSFKHIGIPGLIGCGLAGGDPDRVLKIIERELTKVEYTIVYLK